MIKYNIHTAGNLRAVGKGHGNRIAGSQIGSDLQIHSHQAVHAQNCQGTMLQHHVLDAVTGLGIDCLHLAAGSGRDGGSRLVILCIDHFVLDVLQRFPDLDDGSHDADPVHFRHGIALGHGVAVLHQEFGDLHAGGQFHVHGVSGDQGAAAQEDCVNVTGLDCGFQDAGHGAVFLRFLLRQKGHHSQQGHDGHNADPGDILFDSFLLCVIHINLRSAGRRWASSWPPCWPDTVRRPRR